MSPNVNTIMYVCSIIIGTVHVYQVRVSYQKSIIIGNELSPPACIHTPSLLVTFVLTKHLGFFFL